MKAAPYPLTASAKAARMLLEKIENPQSSVRTVQLEGLLNVRGSSDPRMLERE